MEPGVCLGPPDLGWGVVRAPTRGRLCPGSTIRCAFWVQVFTCKMRILEGISLLSMLRFHDSMLLICFGLKFLSSKCSFVKIFTNGLQYAGPCAGCWGERNTPCVKMFTVFLWRQIIIILCRWYWVGWVHRLNREGPLTEPGVSTKASW